MGVRHMQLNNSSDAFEPEGWVEEPSRPACEFFAPTKSSNFLKLCLIKHLLGQHFNYMNDENVKVVILDRKFNLIANIFVNGWAIFKYKKN